MNPYNRAMKQIGGMPVGYGEITERKASGAHYTPVELSHFVAKKIWENTSSDKTNLSALDPAVGDGELLLALGNTADGRISTLAGFDIDEAAVGEATNKLRTLDASGTSIDLVKCDFLNDISTDLQSSLLDEDTLRAEAVDLVIANPPYIRTQVLGSKQSQDLAKKYGLTGRVDIYHAFIAKIAEILKPGGIAGLIVSNRFMYTQGGKSIRELILREFDVLHIWDFGDTKLFEAAVLPAVLILRKKTTVIEQASTKFTTIYTSQLTVGEVRKGSSIFDLLDVDGSIEVNEQNYTVSTGILHIDDGQPWRLSEQGRDEWLGRIEAKTHARFEDVANVRVGIKTTADKVFIKKDWGEDENELLVPLITHHIARRFRSDAPTTKVLYPYDLELDKKTALDIEKYPLAKKYLYEHKERLESRTYVIEAGRAWYEIWVPHKPSLWKQPKIVFRDISERPTFWADFEGGIVNGDCYWMSFSSSDDYLWLALAVANSTFIEKFYDYKFNNKLYSGRRRFVTQYVNKFPLPDINTELSSKIIALSKSMYEKPTDEKELELDRLVWDAFDAN
jgi:adenine-specific DNA-methyltransferase